MVSEWTGPNNPPQDNRFKRGALRKTAARNGKDVWVSEYGTGKGAEGLARHALVGAGVRGGPA